MENTASQSVTDISAQLDALRLQSFQCLQVMTAVLFKAMETFEAPTDYAGIARAARALITLDKLVKQLYAPPKVARTRAKPGTDKPAGPKPHPVEKAIDIVLPADDLSESETTDAQPCEGQVILPADHPFATFKQPRNRHEARRMAKAMVQAMKKTATG